MEVRKHFKGTKPINYGAKGGGFLPYILFSVFQTLTFLDFLEKKVTEKQNSAELMSKMPGPLLLKILISTYLKNGLNSNENNVISQTE